MSHAPNLLPTPASPPSPQSGENSKKVIIFLTLALLFLTLSATIGGFLFAAAAGFKPALVWARLKSLTLAREKMLQGEKDNRINVLLLGMGGANHEGAMLTDTIILGSLRPSDKKVGLLSIPRDLQVLIPGHGFRKINQLNALAEVQNAGSGAPVAAQAIATLLDQPVHYFLRVDFQAFEEIIDLVGGIEVEVERSFYDPLYPDEDFGYAPIAFEAGQQHFTGERALKFVRSRHGGNGEGNDFARAKRQQKVLTALKERFLSLDMLLRPKRLQHIMESLQDHLQTNLSFWEGLRFAKLLRDVDTSAIATRVLDDAPGGVLTARNYNGAFVLETKRGDWSEVREIAAGLLDASTPSALSSAPASVPLQPVVEIQNGTLVTGLAARTAAQLEALEFNPASIGNAPVRDIERTIVYDLTGGRRKEDFKKLKNTLDAIYGEGEPTQLLAKSKLDFVVILGKNAIPN